MGRPIEEAQRTLRGVATDDEHRSHSMLIASLRDLHCGEGSRTATGKACGAANAATVLTPPCRECLVEVCAACMQPCPAFPNATHLQHRTHRACRRQAESQASSASASPVRDAAPSEPAPKREDVWARFRTDLLRTATDDQRFRTDLLCTFPEDQIALQAATAEKPWQAILDSAKAGPAAQMQPASPTISRDAAGTPASAPLPEQTDAERGMSPEQFGWHQYERHVANVRKQCQLNGRVFDDTCATASPSASRRSLGVIGAVWMYPPQPRLHTKRRGRLHNSGARAQTTSPPPSARVAPRLLDPNCAGSRKRNRTPFH